jgi:hypothetical protein
MALGTAVLIVGVLFLMVISRGFRIAAVVFVLGVIAVFMVMVGIAQKNAADHKAAIEADPVARCMEGYGPCR